MVDDKFVNDTIRQLKCGHSCYLFNHEQVKIIKEKYSKKTKLELEIKKDGEYFIAKPSKAVLKSEHY